MKGIIDSSVSHLLLKAALITSFSLIFSPSILAATYYVHASLGNDVWPGILANGAFEPSGCVQDSDEDGQIDSYLCTDGPWKSFQPLYGVTINDGDSVLLKCDEEWNDPLDLDQINLGTNIGTSPVTFSSYGSSCNSKPKLQLSEAVNTWTQDTTDPSGERYYSDNISFDALQIFVDGTFIRPAQYPNFSYFTIDQTPADKLSLTDADELTIPSGENIDNANIYIRTVDWEIEQRNVIGYDASNNLISWDANTNYKAVKGFGYYLTNKLWMLDARSEWYQDNITKRVYIRLSDGGDPNSSEIMASRYQYGIYSGGRKLKNFEFSNIEIDKPGSIGVYIFNGAGLKISSVDISNSGGQGIYLKNYGTDTTEESTTIEDCIINNTINEGIWIKSLDHALIQRNQVLNTGVIGAPKNIESAIVASASFDTTFSQNIIKNTGYIGIRFGRNSAVSNNLVENACLVLDDCGGIYTWHRPKISGSWATKAQYTEADKYYSTVTGNIVKNVIGNSDGTSDTNKALNSSKGIYLDHGSNVITVSNNTIINAEHGVWVNNGWDNTITQNKLLGNRRSQIGLNEGTQTQGNEVSCNDVNNNTFVSLSLNESVVLQSAHSNIDHGVFDSNAYSDIFSSGLAYQKHKPISDWDYRQYEDGEWQDVNASYFLPFGIGSYQVIGSLDPDLITENTFNGTYGSWNGVPDPINYRNDCPDLDGGCLEISGSAYADNSTNSDPFDVVEGDSYLLTFDAVADNYYQNMRVKAKINGTATIFGLDKVVTVSQQRRHYQYLFTATETLDNSGKIEFEVAANDLIRIDNVYLYKVTNNLIPNGNFYLDVSSWNGWPDAIAQMNPCGLDGGCLDVAASGTTVNSANSASFTVNNGELYRLTFDAHGAQDNQQALIKVKLAGGETPIGLSELINVSVQKNQYAFDFVASESTASAKIDLEVLAGNRIFFDNVYLSKVIVQQNDYKNDVCILVNDQQTAKNFDCSTSCGDVSKCNDYVTLSGVPVNWPITVADFDAEILIWTNSAFKDTDRDSYIDTNDNCPLISNVTQVDSDEDGIGDACDTM